MYQAIKFCTRLQVYVDSALLETEDCMMPFIDSRLHKLIDTYQYTIRLLLTVPSQSEVERFLEKERSKQRTYLTQDDGELSSFECVYFVCGVLLIS